MEAILLLLVLYIGEGYCTKTKCVELIYAYESNERYNFQSADKGRFYVKSIHDSPFMYIIMYLTVLLSLVSSGTKADTICWYIGSWDISYEKEKDYIGRD